jgi:hypothetical protein
VIPTAINGISGYIGAALLGRNVMVSAQQNGAIVSSTVKSVTPVDITVANQSNVNFSLVP